MRDEIRGNREKYFILHILNPFKRPVKEDFEADHCELSHS